MKYFFGLLLCLLLIATVLFVVFNVYLINNANNSTSTLDFNLDANKTIIESQTQQNAENETSEIKELNKIISEDSNNDVNKNPSNSKDTNEIKIQEDKNSSFTVIENNENDSTTTVPEKEVPVFAPIDAEQEKSSFTVNSFIYQLQDVNYNELKEQNADLVVVDPSELSSDQIKELQSKGTIVLSYLSIGEAEKWRDYWKKEWDTNPPFWIDENQEQDNSLVVKYWEKDWQELTFLRMNEMQEKGFDGFVLDTVSTGYHYWEKQGLDKNYTRNEMVKFVKEIKINANKKYIFVNNAGSLLDYEGYLEAIDGMTSEEAFYYNDAPATWSDYDVAYLDKVISAEKPVLAIDYSTKKDLQCDFIKKAEEHEFVPFVTTKELDVILKIDCN